MTRDGCLKEAEKCVCHDRESQYGSPEDNFATIAKYWSFYLDKEIDAKDVAALMALMKMARIQSGRFKADSYVDACGYLACGCEIASKEKEEEKEKGEEHE